MHFPMDKTSIRNLIEFNLAKVQSSIYKTKNELKLQTHENQDFQIDVVAVFYPFVARFVSTR